VKNNWVEWLVAFLLGAAILVVAWLLMVNCGWGATITVGGMLQEQADSLRIKAYVGDQLSFDSVRTSTYDATTTVTVNEDENTAVYIEGQWVAGDNPWVWAFLFIDKADTAYVPAVLPETAHSVRYIWVGDDTTYVDTTLDSVMDLSRAVVVPENMSYLRYDVRYQPTDSPATMAFTPFIVPPAAVATADTVTPVRFIVADITAEPITTARITVTMRAEHDSMLVSLAGVVVFPPMSISSAADAYGEATINLYPTGIFTDSTYYIAEIRATNRRFEDRLMRWKFTVPRSDTTVLFHLLPRWR